MSRDVFFVLTCSDTERRHAIKSTKKPCLHTARVCRLNHTEKTVLFFNIDPFHTG